MNLGSGVCDSIGRNHCLRQFGTASARACVFFLMKTPRGNSKSMEKSKMGVTDSSSFLSDSSSSLLVTPSPRGSRNPG